MDAWILTIGILLVVAVLVAAMSRKRRAAQAFEPEPPAAPGPPRRGFDEPAGRP
ncbi:MAG TPA: hypothetical protein VIN04_14425 [Myxococcota bacterium]